VLLPSPLGVIGGPSVSASLIQALGRYGLSTIALRAGVRGSIFGLSDYGALQTSEAIAGAAVQRHYRARVLQRSLAEDDIAGVLHIGIDALAPPISDTTAHYLYTDHTWHLSRRHQSDATNNQGPVHELEAFERACYAQCAHIFTFGTHVADDLVCHYGVASERVSVVGCGVDDSIPDGGPKDYAASKLISVIRSSDPKSSRLLIDAMELARRVRPDLLLSIVDGDAPAARAKLRALLPNASLLVQPMLDGPGGLLVLDALAARTPVVGLDRNGLAAITANGAFGFLIANPDPAMLAAAILEGLDDPARLAQMGTAGRLHALNSYAWDSVARVMAGIIAGEARASLAA
jgi:glycosyltransferase involved in cell wall biosynthesis